MGIHPDPTRTPEYMEITDLKTKVWVLRGFEPPRFISVLDKLYVFERGIDADELLKQLRIEFPLEDVKIRHEFARLPFAHCLSYGLKFVAIKKGIPLMLAGKG